MVGDAVQKDNLARVVSPKGMPSRRSRRPIVDERMAGGLITKKRLRLRSRIDRHRPAVVKYIQQMVP
jgi:hypothetical protein